MQYTKSWKRSTIPKRFIQVPIWCFVMKSRHQNLREIRISDIPKKEYVVATNGVNFLPFLQSFEFPDMFAWLNLLGSIAIPRTDRCLHPRVRATSSGYPIPLIYLELHSEYFWSSRLLQFV